MSSQAPRPITMLDAAVATGAGGAHSQQRLISDSSYTVNITGAPSAVTVDIEGSFDGETFFQIAQHAMTAGELTATKAMFHIAGKPVMFIRVNLTTLTAGTSPTVTVAGMFA